MHLSGKGMLWGRRRYIQQPNCIKRELSENALFTMIDIYGKVLDEVVIPG
jgi:hypothetical protein